jgi:aquaporin Z
MRGASMQDLDARAASRGHWLEYAIEAGALALFMLSACVFTTLVEHPASMLAGAVQTPLARRVLLGMAMGATAIAIVHSPWGKRSGAHLNPAVTLTFWRLGKIGGGDAAFYVLAQFLGAIAGVLLASAALGRAVIAHPAVNYAVTVPGTPGIAVAFAAEAAIAFGMMLMVLVVSNRVELNRYTARIAGLLVAVYITFEAPLSGMSMNPARSFGSALAAGGSSALWIYFVAPLVGMLAAAEAYVRTNGRAAVLCCKLHHDNAQPCIFRCAWPAGHDAHAHRLAGAKAHGGSHG